MLGQRILDYIFSVALQLSILYVFGSLSPWGHREKEPTYISNHEPKKCL